MISRRRRGERGVFNIKNIFKLKLASRSEFEFQDSQKACFPNS